MLVNIILYSYHFFFSMKVLLTLKLEPTGTFQKHLYTTTYNSGEEEKVKWKQRKVSVSRIVSCTHQINK